MKMRLITTLLLSAVLVVSAVGCGIDSSLNSADEVAGDGHEEGDEHGLEEGHGGEDEHMEGDEHDDSHDTD